MRTYPVLPRPAQRPSGLRDQERAENFPVALRVLPAAVRGHLQAVYDVVRVVDDLGDEAPGDRVLALHAFADDLAQVWQTGSPQAPVLRRLVPTVLATDLPPEPFEQLVAANLQDQHVTSYETWDDLAAYCRLSAEPVGRLVLHLFGVDDERACRLADRACTALQLLEHLQDVAEDRRAGRVYLPAEDLAAFGVPPADLDRASSSPALRRLVAFETERAAELLRAGTPLLAGLRGWARVAVGGYLAGGWAAVHALRAPATDVLAAPPRARRLTVLGVAPLLLTGRTPGGDRLDAAYAECVAITGREARNFAYGIRLLPPDKRAVLCAVYALARRIDDIGDGDLPPAEKQARLQDVRAALHSPALHSPALHSPALRDEPDPVLLAVHDAAARYPVPLGAFEELVQGVEMDLAGRRYSTFEELVDYCRCVAGSVGRLCLGVFGSRADARAASWADALGIALQQTNILRDVREDLQHGRVYLPQDDLDAFGVELVLSETGELSDPDGGLAALLRHSARRAQQWYDDGLRLVPLLDRRSAACCAAMAGIYRQLLARIEADPTLVYDRRLSLSGREKSAVAARALAGRLR